MAFYGLIPIRQKFLWVIPVVLRSELLFQSFQLLLEKNYLIPILCGVFFIETLSVIFQVSYFKYSRSKTGVGKRIFKMAPLHHHYQKLGFHESKIVARFWIIGIVLAVITIVTLKIR